MIVLKCSYFIHFIFSTITRRAAPSAEFSVDQTRHLMSFLTMLGPSPDWNVGLSGEDLCTKECGWVQKLETDLIPWDAGTDGGITYEVIYGTVVSTWHLLCLHFHLMLFQADSWRLFQLFCFCPRVIFWLQRFVCIRDRISTHLIIKKNVDYSDCNICVHIEFRGDWTPVSLCGVSIASIRFSQHKVILLKFTQLWFAGASGEWW